MKGTKSMQIFLKAFLTVFVVGYCFFLSSSFWFPTQDLVSASGIGETFTWEERSFTLLSWEYSESQRMMEIWIDVNNTSKDLTNEYAASALERTKGMQDTEFLINSEDFLVIRINNVDRNWAEISLRISIMKEDDSSTDYLKLYTNKREISRTEIIPDRTENEYYLEKIRGNIQLLEKEIDEIEGSVSENKEQIEKYGIRIAELEGEKEYQTEAEAAETDSLIAQIRNDVASLQSANESCNEEIVEYRERIEKLEEAMKEYE